jgi:serine/threonine-protein phosphatase 2A regulatory subunit A
MHHPLNPMQTPCSDELKSDEAVRRLNSVQRLSTIALALGEERTRGELLPFLAESNDDEDEVLLAMAEELGKFVPYVGGPPHAHALLAPLEALAQVEETVVRDKAVESICSVGETLPDMSVAEHLVPLIKVGGGD